MLDRLDDTIVAISSAPGCGLVGIVRLTGAAAVAIAARMARSCLGGPLSSIPGSTRVSGEVRLDKDRSLPAVFYVFRAPRSYTRQDLIEIHTTGSPAVLEVVRRRALELGAIPAEPGEFTARAFLNGAMDLTSAEAVAGLIRAQTDTRLRGARRMMDGTLSKQVISARDELAELLALVEADIDFAEEPIEFITPAGLQKRLGTVSVRLNELLAGSVCVETLAPLPRILLLGRPHVGKSTLMNRLCGSDRAICAASPGVGAASPDTTRDVLSASVRLGRCEAVLLDAAGVDESQDELRAAAREMTLSTISRVDLVCLVVSVTDPAGACQETLLAHLGPGALARSVVAVNKCDLVSVSACRRAVKQFESCQVGPVHAVSALDGTGVEDLRATLGAMLGDASTTTLSEAVLISERQRSAIGSASEAIKRAAALSSSAVETIDCADVLAFELREALDHLGMVTGMVTTEDLLTQVFANFCIGK